MQTRLVRSETNKMIGGVCGGIAAYLNVDSVLVRFAFVMLLFASGIALPLYFILLILMPSEAIVGGQSGYSDEGFEQDIRFSEEEVSTLKNEDKDAGTGQNQQGPIIFAAVLILSGLYLLAQNFGFLSFLDIGWFGPLLIIGIGLYVIYRRR